MTPSGSTTEPDDPHAECCGRGWYAGGDKLLNCPTCGRQLRYSDGSRRGGGQLAVVVVTPEELAEVSDAVAERAAVVAFLRRKDEKNPTDTWGKLTIAADAIERGEHVQKSGGAP
jgi:hypothetical protein